MASSPLPTATQVALNHLQKEHPYSAFTIGSFVNPNGDKVFIVKRKGIATSRKGYANIWLRASDKCVVGGAEAFAGRGEVLVTADGKVPSPTLSPRRSSAQAGTPSLLDNFFERAKGYNLDKDDPNFPFIIGGIVVVVAVALKVLVAFRSVLVLLPLYLVFKNTQPKDFDAKKELKRVLRKENLPDSHPDKPKGWLGKMATKAAASLAGEAMTAAGYKVRHDEFLGCIRIAMVELDLDGSTCMWIGCLNKVEEAGGMLLKSTYAMSPFLCHE
eukprot:CAMPEP_0182453730 /NCGR_PEP_ID=MMETSP1319-20130603/671_1 /TAXON_ID=172717 /ORGANISM="Bolidomonas pacifica, Strain RCC208" /LENGTH=271 /DNA_ID=CAMNT_0024651683 /DNA_START=150 /DNA_END=963 /DNA_ORIENTATION=+